MPSSLAGCNTSKLGHGPSVYCPGTTIPSSSDSAEHDQEASLNYEQLDLKGLGVTILVGLAMDSNLPFTLLFGCGISHGGTFIF